MSALTLRVPIRFSDIDAFNHVNHTRYLSYCEDHRMEMLADLRKTAPDLPFLPNLVVRRVEVDYLVPAVLADREIEVRGTTTHVGTSSFRIRYELATARGVCATMDAVLVQVDDAGVPSPLDPAYAAWLEAHRA